MIDHGNEELRRLKFFKILLVGDAFYRSIEVFVKQGIALRWFLYCPSQMEVFSYHVLYMSLAEALYY